VDIRLRDLRRAANPLASVWCERRRGQDRAFRTATRARPRRPLMTSYGGDRSTRDQALLRACDTSAGSGQRAGRRSDRPRALGTEAIVRSSRAARYWTFGVLLDDVATRRRVAHVWVGADQGTPDRRRRPKFEAETRSALRSALPHKTPSQARIDPLPRSKSLATITIRRKLAIRQLLVNDRAGTAAACTDIEGVVEISLSSVNKSFVFTDFFFFSVTVQTPCPPAASSCRNSWAVRTREAPAAARGRKPQSTARNADGRPAPPFGNGGSTPTDHAAQTPVEPRFRDRVRVVLWRT